MSVFFYVILSIKQELCVFKKKKNNEFSESGA